MKLIPALKSERIMVKNEGNKKEYEERATQLTTKTRNYFLFCHLTVSFDQKHQRSVSLIRPM